MKNVVITGANSGLGFETAKKVAENSDYKLILACRNAEKAKKAKEQIIAETGNQNVITMSLDTSSLASVRAFADEFIKTGEKLDALVNNAGISSMNNTGTTEDGFELVFETNYLGHFLLTQLLLPYMSENARIYNISSDMHNPPGGISWQGAEILAHPKEDDRKKYAYSKLCMIYFTHELNRNLQKQGKHIIVNSFNPGFMADTNFSKGGGKARELVVKTTMPDRFGKLSSSSDALAELITSDAFSDISGEYYDRSTKTAKSSELSYSEENAAELWEASKRFCNIAI